MQPLTEVGRCMDTIASNHYSGILDLAEITIILILQNNNAGH